LGVDAIIDVQERKNKALHLAESCLRPAEEGGVVAVTARVAVDHGKALSLP